MYKRQGVDGETSYNINADTAAAKLAVALKAEKLILLTDVRGILRDPKDENSLIHVVHMPEVATLIEDGIISGGMIPKLECCVDSIRGGVSRAHILDGRVPHSIPVSYTHLTRVWIWRTPPTSPSMRSPASSRWASPPLTPPMCPPM